MKKPRRQPVTSIEQTIKLIGDVAKGPPEPPAHVKLRPWDMPFWDGIIAQRARDDWTEVDLVVAAQLARTQADIETESQIGQDTDEPRKLMLERVVILDKLSNREMALIRTLRLAGLGNASDVKERRRLERQAESLAAESSEDEDRLLA